MSSTTSIKAITPDTFDRALEELEREAPEPADRHGVRGSWGAGKTHVFFDLVRRYARPLDEVEAEGRDVPILVIIDEAHGLAESELLSVLLHGHRTREQLRDLIDVLTPPQDIPSQATVEQARRNAEARTQFLGEFPTLTSSDVAELVGSRSRNRAALAHGWRKQGRILAVQVGREQRYPLFQFEVDAGEPKPVIAEVVAALRSAGLDGWQVALWFTGALSQLEDRRPVDLLETEPERVLVAARSVGQIPY